MNVFTREKNSFYEHFQGLINIFSILLSFFVVLLVVQQAQSVYIIAVLLFKSKFVPLNKV